MYNVRQCVEKESEFIVYNQNYTALEGTNYYNYKHF